MTEPLIIRDSWAFCDAFKEIGRGAGTIASFEFRHGEIAVCFIENATAEELLAALRGRLGHENAKLVVSILLDGGVTFDSTIEHDIEYENRGRNAQR